jgi:hypothetical protein
LAGNGACPLPKPKYSAKLKTKNRFNQSFFAFVVYINATSTPDLKNRNSTHKQAATRSRVQRSATRRHSHQLIALCRKSLCI